MKIVARLAVVAIGLLATIRAVGFLISAALRFGLPLEVSAIEPKMAHLAWRVAAGLPLYPDWKTYPHVCNFLGPCNFVLVGLAARWLRVDYEGLMLVGRVLTLGSALLTSLVVARAIGRRSGFWAGLIGGLASLGSAPMIGHGLMVGPATLAELLGVVGFFLALARPIVANVAGGVLLALAILTRPSAVVFLLAAALTLVLSKRRRAGSVLFGTVALGVAAVVALVTIVREPHFAASLGAGLRLPWDPVHWLDRLGRLAREAPDLVIIPPIGLALWFFRPPRDFDRIVLALLIVAASIAAAGKVGSRSDGFLSLRIVEALAIGAIIRLAIAANPRPSPRVATAAVLTAAALFPGARLAIREARAALETYKYLRQPAGRQQLAELRQLERIAEKPFVRILTNSGLLQLHQGARAEFLDPRLFRLQVEAGLIDPAGIRRALEQEAYDYIITVEDLNDSRYPSFPNGLPMTLVLPARAHYRPLQVRANLHLYVPRRRHSGLTGRTRLPSTTLPAEPRRFGPALPTES